MDKSSESNEPASSHQNCNNQQTDCLDKDNQVSEQCESPTTNDHLDENRIVKHIMVIGFHHKHGYQVDYCYPPLQPNGPVFSTQTKPITLPRCWKTLPLLCLPDGSHNHDSDTIYFTMPDVSDSGLNVVTRNDEQSDIDEDDDYISSNIVPNQQDANTTENSNNPSSSSCSSSEHHGIKTIFGTACYRQIQVDKLLNKTDDMTRVAVQKSVCVLSTKPLFGLIRSKLEMITHAYFEELDFSKVRILKLTYDNLNSLLSRDSVKENATFLGLSTRQLVSHFGCNMLVLFKAMLLEKKILFYKSPVRDLCSTIMSMCSLFTGLLESGGLDYSTCDLQLSPTLLEALKLSAPVDALVDEFDATTANKRNSDDFVREDKVFFSPHKEEVVIIPAREALLDSTLISLNSDMLGEDGEGEQKVVDLSKKNEGNIEGKSLKNEANEKHVGIGDFELISAPEDIHKVAHDNAGEDEISFLADGSVVDDPFALRLCRLKPEDCGLPLQIFTRGSFCLPYLSVSYLDLLSDKRVKSFVIGATNFLFKQRKEMYDIIVDMEENTITINDLNLKRCLSLSTEDLRFMDYLGKHVKLDEKSQPKDEFDLISQDITKWVGGDEWIRYHFRLYTLYLLKASKISGSSARNLLWDSFNSQFMQSWKQTTNNYKIWDSANKWSMLNGLQSRHPFSSTAKGLNFSDMKLKLSYAVNSSEKGKLINQTLSGIGKWSIWNNLAAAATTVTNNVVAQAAAATTASSSSTTTTTTAAVTSKPPERLSDNDDDATRKINSSEVVEEKDHRDRYER